MTDVEKRLTGTGHAYMFMGFAALALLLGCMLTIPYTEVIRRKRPSTRAVSLLTLGVLCLMIALVLFVLSLKSLSTFDREDFVGDVVMVVCVVGLGGLVGFLISLAIRKAELGDEN